MRCVLDLDWHHRNMLQCVDSILPSTVRGLHFQQVLAINLAIKLIDRQEDEKENTEQEKENKLRLDYPIKVYMNFDFY